MLQRLGPDPAPPPKPEDNSPIGRRKRQLGLPPDAQLPVDDMIIIDKYGSFEKFEENKARRRRNRDRLEAEKAEEEERKAVTGSAIQTEEQMEKRMREFGL